MGSPMNFFWTHSANNNGTMLNSSTVSRDSQPLIPKSANLPLSKPATQMLMRSLTALIIGIDDYAHVTKLRGAVADAKEMEAYLRVDLGVPKGHIRTLFNHDATRDAITAAFEELRDDSNIKKGDPIVIFFAGHGKEVPTPRGWGDQATVQCILPQNYEASKMDPIPDRTIGALIQDIAEAKGDNIVVIFDCCHAASGTRDPDDIARTVDLTIEISDSLDADIWGDRSGTIAHGFAYHGLQSHVLLAACSEQESAYEREGHGRFTRALLEVLRLNSVQDLTYTDVIAGIHIEKQTPQCEGVNRHRFLFSTRVPACRRDFYAIRAKNNKYVIDAGLAHGVSCGAEFTLYCERKIKLQNTGPVPVIDASSIGDFQTTITPSKFYPKASFAKLTRIGKLPIYLSPGNNQLSLLKDALGRVDNGINAQKFQIVKKVKEAKLEVAIKNGQVVFKTVDERMKALGLRELSGRVALDNLAHVLNSAALFFWFLDLKNPKSDLGNNKDLSIDFYLLKGALDRYGIETFTPLKPGFCKKDGSSYKIDFVVEPEAVYGIEIKNNIPRDLYLNAFLFDNSTLGISVYYTQSSAGTPVAPLKKGETFTIGYGNSGMPPCSYILEDGQDVDLSYLKLFFATRPIDLSDIKQESPFPSTSSGLESRHGSQNSGKHGALDIEFSIQIPVIQRRKKRV